MFKRYFVACKLHHLITPICVLMFIVGSQTVHPQQQIATDTYAIFQQSCLICHGVDGAYKETLLMEHDTLISEGTVVPGNPDASLLYDRVIGTPGSGPQMPLGQPPLSAQAINTIRNWILAGAPDWATPTTLHNRFISPAEILTTIETHLMSLTPFDRGFARYFTMTHLYNAGESADRLQGYRKGLSKLVNSLSWGVTVTNPQPIDSQGTIFYIDLRHYEWDRNDAWTQIEGAYPYHIGFEAPAQTSLRTQLGRLQKEMKSNIPSVHVDWFIAKASLPPLYHGLLSLPLTVRELETRLEVDVAQNLQNAPGVRVWRAGTNDSRVSSHNRVIERHISRYGAYWKSYDFAGSVGTQNIFNHPLSFTPDGGEAIFNLPNGLQGYYITNASGSRLDAAPTDIVSNPAASNPKVRNGLSCFGCHTEGMKTIVDQVRPVIVSNTNPTYDKAQALRLYVEQSVMDGRVQEDMNHYRGALQSTGGAFSDIEPISRFHEAFQGSVDAAYAAAVVGLEKETFLAKIRENVGLQNAGLLVLDSPNGSMKRDAWTDSFNAMIYALDFPEAEVDSPSQPEQLPGTVVHIPDSNLRAAITEVLGKSPNAPITTEELEKLKELDAPDRGIHDLTGLQFATNLEWLHLGENQISNLSPITGLINLKVLRFSRNNVSDLSSIAGLINLRYLAFHTNNVSDLSPIARLINVEVLRFSVNNISDLTPLVGLINLKHIFSWGNPVSDLSPLTGLTKMEEIDICGADLSDLTPLARLTGLKELYLRSNGISDISSLAGLTGLTRLNIAENDISDISPLAGLTNLKWLNVGENDISEITSLVGLTNLQWLAVYDNEISDFSPLDGLRENIKFLSYANPASPKGGPKIEGPWLWVVLPNTRLDSSKDLLSEASGGEVTETEIATHGPTVGGSVGDSVWTSHKLPTTGYNNIEDMLKREIRDGIVYGSVSLYSSREQKTTMYVGGERDFKVWLNGVLIFEDHRSLRSVYDVYTDFFSVTLKQGRNVLLVAIHTEGNGFFGFEPGTEYTVTNPGVRYTFSQPPIHIGDTFTLDISAEDVFDMAGWQFDIAFDPAVLEAVSVSEGDFLKTGGSTTFFQGGNIDNAAGKITGLNAARLSTQGVGGTGTLLQVNFKAKSGGETKLTLQNFQFGSVTGDSIPAGPHEITIAVEGHLATGDVNRDGQVSILDLILVSQQLGKRVAAGSPVDVNGDGVVSILDLITVSGQIGSTPASAAPPNPPAPLSRGEGRVDAATVAAWIAQARLENDGSLAFKKGIENLERLLASLIPEETALLANYPNPFNPETWIPYQLAESAEVTLTIYDMNGKRVRRLAVGHQAAGMYRSHSRAAYWDGRNQLGEAVASGLYFYTLTVRSETRAAEFAATRRMLILK